MSSLNLLITPSNELSHFKRTFAEKALKELSRYSYFKGMENYKNIVDEWYIEIENHHPIITNNESLGNCCDICGNNLTTTLFKITSTSSHMSLNVDPNCIIALGIKMKVDGEFISTLQEDKEDKFVDCMNEYEINFEIDSNNVVKNFMHYMDVTTSNNKEKFTQMLEFNNTISEKNFNILCTEFYNYHNKMIDWSILNCFKILFKRNNSIELNDIALAHKLVISNDLELNNNNKKALKIIENYMIGL